MSSPWPEELPRGFQFERFEILDCVSRGAVARVYRARSQKDGVVALKVFERAASDRLPDFRRLSKNVRAAAAVRHPNVAAILASGVWRERSFLVTEWLDGCDLRDYLDRWRVMAEDEVAELGLHLISGLLALHAAGAIHGDLKPSSIFLCDGSDGDVVPKLLLAELPYFNVLAGAVDSTTRDISVSTPAYTPPEAVRRGGSGPAGDQYSLGAVLYECAVGRAPFTGGSLLELLRALAAGDIPSPRASRPELSERFEAAILQSLSADPRARFANLRELGRALWPLASERARGPWAPAFGSAAGAEAGDGKPARARRRRGPALPTAGDPDRAGAELAGSMGRRIVAGAGASRPPAMLLLAASIALSIGLGALYVYTLRGRADTRIPQLDTPAGETRGSLNARF